MLEGRRLNTMKCEFSGRLSKARVSCALFRRGSSRRRSGYHLSRNGWDRPDRRRKNKGSRLHVSSLSASSEVVEETIRELEAAWEEAFNIQGGIDGRSCSVGLSEGQLKLVANREIEEGDVLLRVPINETLSEAMFDEIFDAGAVGQLETWMKLVLVLMHVRRNDSSGLMKWRSFLNRLDSDTFRKHPLMWSEEDLTKLEGSQMYLKLCAYREYLEAVWGDMQQFVFPALGMENATKDEFFWAFGVLKTNALRPFSQPQSLRIAPMLNMLSHGRRSNCNTKFASSGIFKKDETLDLIAAQRINKGGVLHYDFDPSKPETEILVDYGVIDPYAPKKGTELTLSLSEDDFNFGDKADIVEEMANLSISHVFTVGGGEDGEGAAEVISEDVFAFLRLVQLKDADAFLLESVFRNDVWGFLQEPVSRENEANVCSSMIESCKQALGEFPTTIEEDQAILASMNTTKGSEASLHSHARTAVDARLLEKQSWQALLNFFLREKARLSVKEYYQERRLKSLGLLDMDGNSTY